jgi:hypothetical protein
MKRIVIMLLIACSAITTISAQQKKGVADNTPINVKALFYNILKTWGNPADEVYSVNRNPNTNQIESSVKITYFVANVNTGSVRLNLSTIADAFKKDEPKAYQVLHLSSPNKESFSLSVYNENGQNANYLVRGMEYEEMWLLCVKNAENPKLRDAYAIKWTLNDEKSKALGAIYQITSLRPDQYAKALESNKRMFKIVGRVDDEIKDSLYNIYIAESREALYNLEDHEYVACIPVVNKRFEWQTELSKPCVGRLRCIFPDGSLCSAWIDLDFVPGETYNITVHNGYYDEDKDYERRVGRQSGKSLINKQGALVVVADTVEVIDDIPVLDDNDIVLNGVEFAEPENQWGAQAIPITRGQEHENVEAWTRSLAPQKQALLMFKAKGIEACIERVKASYKPLGELMKGGMPFNKVSDKIFENIAAQNKELDKNVQEFQKALFALNPPVSMRQSLYSDAYKEILNTLTEQNKGFTEIYTKTGSLPKSAQKTQKYINKLIEKYMNEMIKGMQ